jgi:hypothetical protein
MPWQAKNRRLEVVSEVYSYARDSSLNGLVPEKSYRNCAIVSF